MKNASYATCPLGQGPWWTIVMLLGLFGVLYVTTAIY